MKKLIAKHLAKYYKGRAVVHDVSIEVAAGEIVGLLGPNGAGKTTSFYMIVGLVRPDNGQVLYGTEDITDLPMYARARLGMGYLPQEPSVFRKLTVADNILAVLELRPDLNPVARQEQVTRLLQELHLMHVRDIMGISLSGGERRRVEIARALAYNPEFILLDEPFAGIDPISVVDIKKIILHLKDRGIGVLITDHNVRETLDICERAYIVNEGHILYQGTPDAVMRNQKVRDVYLGEEFG
jgi:lipopolysaccharide export system ATP-binding protein